MDKRNFKGLLPDQCCCQETSPVSADTGIQDGDTFPGGPLNVHTAVVQMLVADVVSAASLAAFQPRHTCHQKHIYKMSISFLDFMNKIMSQNAAKLNCHKHLFQRSLHFYLKIR